jgi:undecaprenyl diphosphate synthase
MQKELHVAIIMDGNGRWATRRGLPRVAGHRAGIASVQRVVERAPDLGIRRLTLYAFSSDNWRRPADEVESIFWLLRTYLRLRRKDSGSTVRAWSSSDVVTACHLHWCATSLEQNTQPLKVTASICASPWITLRAMPSREPSLAYPPRIRWSYSRPIWWDACLRMR